MRGQCVCSECREGVNLAEAPHFSLWRLSLGVHKLTETPREVHHRPYASIALYAIQDAAFETARDGIRQIRCFESQVAISTYFPAESFHIVGNRFLADDNITNSAQVHKDALQ